MPNPETRPRFRNAFAAVLLCLFTGVGVLLTVAVAIDWLQAVDTHSWRESRCTIEASEVARTASGEYELEVSYSYSLRGQRYQGRDYRHGYAGSDDVSEAERLQARYAEGSRVPCWVDPDDPQRAYLRRGNLWRGFLIFLPLTFVAVGGGSLRFLYLLRRPAPDRAPVDAAEVGEPKPFKSVAILVGFFGIFFLSGVGFFVPFFLRPALQVVEARSWRPVPCEIVSSGVRSHSGDDGETYSIEALYRYEIDGREYRANRYQFLGGSSSGYESKAAAVARIPAGATVTCYVSPDDPFDAVIERGFTPDYLFGLVPVIFVLVGAGGMAAVIVGARTLRKEAGRPSWTGRGRQFGADEAAFVSGASAGVGPLTLEPARSRLGKLGCAVFLALFWNGIVAPFVWHLVQEWRAGRTDWILTIFLIPFVLVGLALLSGIPFGILALANPRPRVRLSRGAIPAGESAEVQWSFRGAAGRIRRLRIWLQASETTTETESHRSGVSMTIRTEPLEGTRIEILDRGRGEGLESGWISFRLPPDIPPSSTGDRAVRWKLHLSGEIRFWPDLSEEYEIEVLPPAGSDG